MSVLEERLPYIDKIRLGSGSHPAPSNGLVNACVMEAVAYVAGEPWSDHPECASRVLTNFLIRLNDRWDDEARQLLKPFIVRLVGTNTGDADEATRRLMIRDWMLREYAPAMFRHAGLNDLAVELEGMADITGTAEWAKARERLYEIRDAQWKRRREAVERLRGRVADADADAVAAAVADAAADAVAVAVADAVADAAAVADAVAVADAAADADAAAVADAAAAAAPFKDAVEAAAKKTGYWDKWQAAYDVLRPYYDERYKDVFGGVGWFGGIRESVLGLVDRLIEVGR